MSSEQKLSRFFQNRFISFFIKTMCEQQPQHLPFNHDTLNRIPYNNSNKMVRTLNTHIHPNIISKCIYTNAGTSVRIQSAFIINHVAIRINEINLFASFVSLHMTRYAMPLLMVHLLWILILIHTYRDVTWHTN